MWTVLTPGDGEITIFRFVCCFQERKMKRDLSWSSNFGLKERKLWRYLKSLTAGKIKMLTQQKKMNAKYYYKDIWTNRRGDQRAGRLIWCSWWEGGRVCLTTAGAASPESRTGPGKRLSRTARCRDFSQPTLSPLPADQEAREHCSLNTVLYCSCCTGYRTSLHTTDYTSHHTYSSMLILKLEQSG